MLKNAKANKAYEVFHGQRPKKVLTGKFHVPTHLILLGTAIEIVYRCDKFNGGGDGKIAEYIHKFSKGTRLYMDERKGKVIYVTGHKLKVTSAGIEN